MASGSRERDPRTYDVIGAAMQVHRELGPGFLEAVYQGALAICLEEQGIPFQREVPLPVTFHGRPVGAPYRADFVCYGDIIVELKAIANMGRSEVAQLANYLSATRLPLGLLINFGSTSLDFQRVIGRHAVPRQYEGDAQLAGILGNGETVTPT